MGMHPNVILMAVLTPHGLARKTMGEILGHPYERDGKEIQIDGEGYNTLVMESDYDDSLQIAAKEGELVFWDMPTYGYGDVVTWAKLEQQKNALEAWAKETAEKHHCDVRIDVSANYW